jgi:hypothetical protein
MELDDYKSIRQKSNTALPGSEEGFCIQDLYKRVDDSARKGIRKVRLHIALLVSMTLIYLTLAVSGELKEGLLIIATGFMAGAIYLAFRYRPLPDDYFCLPLTEFIKLAKTRLIYFSLSDWLIIPVILILLGIGGGIHLVSRLTQYTDAKNLIIIIWVAFYTGLCIFGYFAGRKNWIKEHADLLKYLKKFDNML